MEIHSDKQHEKEMEELRRKKAAKDKLLLRSAWWRHVRRLQEAKTEPYRSLLEGRDTGTEALFRFQAALLLIRGQSNAYNRPYVYDIPTSEFDGLEAAHSVYGPFTKRAVANFQDQSKIGSDGIAGQITLAHLDSALVRYYDATLPVSRPVAIPATGGV